MSDLALARAKTVGVAVALLALGGCATFSPDGDQVAFYFPTGMTMSLGAVPDDELPPAPVEKFRWRVEDGAVRLTPLDGTDPLAAATMASHPWQPVADAASV